MPESKAALTAMKVGIGAVAGVTSGVANAAAPHVRAVGTGTMNASASFFNGATKAFRSHKGAAGAISAGTAAVIGHGLIATAVVAAAPVVAVTAAAGGAVFGIYKFAKYIQEEW